MFTEAPPGPVVVLTPNLTGRDGVSHVTRLVTGSFDHATVIALHEPAALTTFGGAEVRSCESRTSRFVSAAVRAAASGDARTLVVALHLHVAPAALAFTARGAQLTIVLHGVEAWKPLTWIQRAAVDRAARLIAVSAHSRDRFRAANPQFAGRAVDVCHLGVDDTPPLPAGAADRRPSALIVGRMASDERYKGHDVLLDVWTDVVRAVPGAALRIVGDGDDRPRLERKAHALGLNGHITFLGRVDDDSLAREYERCTAFVMPSRDEGFGVVFVEAMRAARACVASRGAAAEIVVDGESGLVIAPGDRGALTRAIVRLLADGAEADRMGARGRERFLRHFTDTHFRERFTAIVASPVLALTE